MKTKKAYLMILMSALSIANAYSQLPSYVPSNGLVGYWPFNGNANDESGNGNNGNVNGATLTTDRNGVVNKAYSFNGTNNYIDIQHNSTLNLQDFLTISCWIKTTDILRPQYIINKSTGGTSDSWLFDLNIYGNSATSGVLRMLCGGITGAAPMSNNIVSQTNTWYNVTATYDKQNVKFYINGVLSNSVPLTSQTPINTNIVRIGAPHTPFTTNAFGGSIDDVIIYNRALTQQEITTLYNSCSNPTSTITPQGNTTFCQGGSVNLNASIGANYTYEWYNNGIIINNATSSIYAATTSGNYTVKVTDGACNSTSSTQTVTVNANPSVSLNTLNNVVFKTSLPIQLVGNPSGGIYSGDAVSGNVFTPANASLGKKTISYNYTSQQGCSGSTSQETIVTDSVGNVCSTYDTLKIKVLFTVGLYANTINTIKFYPNPTKDILLIDNGNYQAMSGYSIKIVSLTGTVVYNQPITSQQVQISMNQFATKGLYIAQIVDSNNAIVDSKKIVLE